MNITEHLLPELQSTERLKDSTLTRRYLQAKSLEVSRKRSDGKSKYFIPFAQERDHIGRLIKTNTGDSVEYLNNSNSSKSYLSTGVRQHIRAGNDTPEMLTIEQPSSKNVYKMIESSLANRSEEETVATPSSGVNYINLSAHLYSIGRGEHNTLEVKSPKQKIPVESIVEYQGDLTRSGMAPQFDYSTVRSEMDTTDRNENRTKLPPLQLIKNRNAEMGSPPGLNSSLSSKNLRIRGNRDEANTGQPSLDSSASYINLSAWKFEASQLALNKDVESMMRREKKINNRHAMLTIPQRQDIVPPLGSYKPSLSVIKQRPSNCLILPERLPKSKSPEREQRQEECRKLHVEVKKKPVEEDENQTSEEYYKHLFKGMLQEVDQSKTKGSRKTESRQRPVKNKPLDYIVLDDFKRFPGDFEKKVVDMRKKLRLFKDKLNLCKEYKELE